VDRLSDCCFVPAAESTIFRGPDWIEPDPALKAHMTSATRNIDKLISFRISERTANNHLSVRQEVQSETADGADFSSAWAVLAGATCPKQ
jgi:hypothetical protein